MTIFEHIFSVIGILIIIGGFIYGIYDSYFDCLLYTSDAADD